ncbi:hypothetical protein [Variovorax rhizosphaerae]|uniref:Uncharacterized protein n=1 Tax=Variovorax rhizosphaerae TaxID=1836200 RepID=A0ABU8WQ15_9BURK
MSDVTPAAGSHYLHALNGPEVPLTKAEFDELKQSRSILTDALAFEQKFELLLANWLALEVAAVELGLRAKVESEVAWYEKGSEWFNVLNRHVMNLLTTTRTYVDQVKGDFKHLPITPSFGEEAKARMAKAFDDNFHYRFMEGLRNVAQHGRLPVHNVGGSHGKRHWAESLSFHANRSELEGNRNFRAGTLKETPGAVDLRVASRAYVSSLSEVHVDLRKLVKPHVENARLAFLVALKRYSKAMQVRSVALRAYAPEARKEEPVLVMLDWDAVRAKLAAKNAHKVSIES